MRTSNTIRNAKGKQTPTSILPDTTNSNLFAPLATAGEVFANAISSWATSFPHENNTTQQALLSLRKLTLLEKDARSFGLASTPNRKERKENKKYKKYVAGAIVPIPDRSTKNEDEVRQFIQDTCQNVGEAMKSVISNELFHEILEDAYNSQKMWECCVSPETGQSLFEYIDSCVVEAEPVANYKNILIDYDVKRIERDLFDQMEAEDDDLVNDGATDDDDDDDRKPASIWDPPAVQPPLPVIATTAADSNANPPTTTGNAEV